MDTNLQNCDPTHALSVKVVIGVVAAAIIISLFSILLLTFLHVQVPAVYERVAETGVVSLIALLGRTSSQQTPANTDGATPVTITNTTDNPAVVEQANIAAAHAADSTVPLPGDAKDAGASPVGNQQAKQTNMQETAPAPAAPQTPDPTEEARQAAEETGLVDESSNVSADLEGGK